MILEVCRVKDPASPLRCEPTRHLLVVGQEKSKDVPGESWMMLDVAVHLDWIVGADENSIGDRIPEHAYSSRY